MAAARHISRPNTKIAPALPGSGSGPWRKSSRSSGRLMPQRRGDAMDEPQVWSNVTADNMPVVVLKDSVFYGGAIEVHKFSKFKTAIDEGDDPAELLGADCQSVPLDKVTRVVANSTGDLVIEADGKTALKLYMQKAGVRIVEAIEA